MISNSEVLDTSFRSAIDRMINRGRIEAFTSPIDTNLAVAGVMKKRDGGPALLFTMGWPRHSHNRQSFVLPGEL